MLTFNVVYTSKTVELLYPFIATLLKWSDCSFRLVANGCNATEIGLLQRVCDQHERLEFIALPFANVVRHDQALDYLQSLEQSDYFCFLDSDILVTDYFLTAFTPHLNQYAGLFSGAASWCKAEEQVMPTAFRTMLGRYHHSEQGMCLGSTYFAIYDNQVLTRLIQTTGISFRRYYWHEIPRCYQTELTKLGLNKASYDTGKLLNLCLQLSGYALRFQGCRCIQHVGGVSTLRNDLQSQPSPIRTIDLLHAFVWIVREVAVSRSNKYPMITLNPHLITEVRVRQRVNQRKLKTVHYFTQLLHCLSENQPLPPPPKINDLEIADKVDSVISSIVDLYGKFCLSEG